MFFVSVASASFFWSNQRNEPPHIHVESGDGYAKMWLGPPVIVAESRGLSPRELRTVLEIVPAACGDGESVA